MFFSCLVLSLLFPCSKPIDLKCPTLRSYALHYVTVPAVAQWCVSIRLKRSRLVTLNALPERFVTLNIFQFRSLALNFEWTFCASRSGALPLTYLSHLMLCQPVCCPSRSIQCFALLLYHWLIDSVRDGWILNPPFLWALIYCAILCSVALSKSFSLEAIRITHSFCSLLALAPRKQSYCGHLCKVCYRGISVFQRLVTLC